MAVQTVDDFLAILEKSKLVSASGLQQIRKATAESADAKAVARFLIQRGILTRFQAMQLLAGLIVLNGLLPYAQMALALGIDRAALTWWVRLPLMPIFFAVDVAAALWALVLSLLRQPRRWLPTKRT